MAPRLFNATMDGSAPKSLVEPRIFASASICVENGVASKMEMAAQLQGCAYEPGWLAVYFAEPQDPDGYTIFWQTDVSAKVERFKSEGSFELIFTDPQTGDPVEPGCIDLQILKVK